MDEAGNQGQRLSLEQTGGRGVEHQGVSPNQGHRQCPSRGCWEGGQEGRPFTPDSMSLVPGSQSPQIRLTGPDSSLPGARGPLDALVKLQED